MTEERDTGRDRASDAPVDLTKERESFVRTFFKKGVEVTEELLHENTALREETQRLREDNARLRAQVASDDAIRDLLKTIDQLETEKRHLLERSHKLERTQQHEEHRFEEIEGELNDLANLYIASFQLHASLSPRRVVRHVRDTVGQLVGAEAFAVYAIDKARGVAVPIGQEGLDGQRLEPIPVGEGEIGDACFTGVPRIREELSPGSLEHPLAIIPLVVEGRPVGAIAIVTLLAQKRGWASVDRELFKLLGAHAGTALVAANLYAQAEGPAEALDGLSENLQRRPSDVAPTEG